MIVMDVLPSALVAMQAQQIGMPRVY